MKIKPKQTVSQIMKMIPQLFICFITDVNIFFMS